jgi:hypothetical protein
MKKIKILSIKKSMEYSDQRNGIKKNTSLASKADRTLDQMLKTKTLPAFIICMET